MAVYWLTFRLKDDATYDDRYAKLVDMVSQLKTLWWVETSSFFLFESSQGIDGVAKLAKQAVNPATDIVLIGMPDFKDARVFGPLQYHNDLLKLMPFTKNV